MLQILEAYGHGRLPTLALFKSKREAWDSRKAPKRRGDSPGARKSDSEQQPRNPPKREKTTIPSLDEKINRPNLSEPSDSRDRDKAQNGMG